MKKIVLLVALCLCVGNLFAQDADKLRDEGDAALKAKDYATVVTKYGEYLKQNNYQDTARIFNCGYAANQAKNYAEAAKYFDMAVKMNYNVDDSYVGEAMAYRNLNKTEEFLTTVKEGLKVIPDGNKNKTNLEKLLYGYCIKQGQAAQKKGDLAGAEKMYKEVLAVSNKDYQSNAYYSLGAMLYGNTPNGYAQPERIQPVGRFCARVTRVFMVKAGELIGYDDDHSLMHDTRVAVISAGYADGYPRVFSGKGEIEIHGRRAWVLGLICMDQMMADVTDIPETAPGDTAILLGGGVSLREYAQRGGLNRNECTAIITRRVPRIYL